MGECRKALDLSENDLSEAAQWLVDQGEKERSTKTFYPTSKVIIAESEITSNFSEKNLKGSNEIITKEGSILHTQNINESIWTMDEDEVTCFSEAGIKIFSKSSSESHTVTGACGLSTTLLKTI
jgi:other hect domain ubiquitin protein ligase E3